MHTLYAANTPNGLKPLILLHELGLSYDLVRVDLDAGDQHQASFRALNPNGKIPVLDDEELGRPLFESGAILTWLAERHGRFLPGSPAARFTTLQWLFFQVANVGPMFGQAWHFKSRRDEQPYAYESYLGETRRLYRVLDSTLADLPYLAGDTYTIADIATWPWVRDPDVFGLASDEVRHVRRWIARVGERAAVRSAIEELEV
jgi:GST-like protein